MNTIDIFKKIKALNHFNLEIWNKLKKYLDGEKKSFGVKKFIVRNKQIILERDFLEVKIESMNQMYDKFENFFNFGLKEKEYEDLSALIAKYECLIPEKCTKKIENFKELLEGIQRHLGKELQKIIEFSENFKKLKEWCKIPNDETCVLLKPKKDKEFKGIEIEISLEKENKDYLSKIEKTIEFLFYFCEIKRFQEKPFFDRSFITHQQSEILQNWLEEEKLEEKETNLLYKATENGFEASKFHQFCDGKGRNLVLIQTSEGNIFGGYTDVGWNNSGSVKDEKAFLFSLVNPSKNFPLKSKIKNGGQSAIYDNSSYGPVFGSGHDIKIYSNSNRNNVSYVNCCSSYDFPNQFYLNGKKNFQVSEIEVWGIK
jgi:hypothetical protein